MVHVVSCHIVANVEIGWHATLLTNCSNMDMVKISVYDKSLKCGNYPKKTFSYLAALANLPPTNASEKLLHIVGGLQIWQVENVERGWHAKFVEILAIFCWCARKASGFVHIRTDELKWYSVWNLLWWDYAYSALESFLCKHSFGS